MINKINNKLKSDKGLMGPTHALSAVAFALLFTWLASDFMFNTVLGSKDIVVFVAAVIIIIGSSLMPDLDATKSTSINVLGVMGSFLSQAMRGISTFIQGIIKGPYDKSKDPHRGFWHTLVSAFLVGFIISSLTSIRIELFQIKDFPVTVSTIVVLLLLYISIQLAFSSILKPIISKSKLGGFSTNLIALIVSVILIYALPSNLNYYWVGGAVTFGWITHLLGDMMTVSGVPILFPLKIKGKRWWDIRLPLGIKAGGYIEKAILMPVFAIIILVSLYNIIPLFI